MRRRRLLLSGGTVAAGFGLVLLTHPAAGAVDLWGNVAPAPQLPSGALAHAYPLGNYAIDHHFSAVKAGVFSGVDVSGLAPTVAWLLANLLWQLTALVANAVITLFTFAFSLDLVNGSQATGGAGALEPVSQAIRSIYDDVFGQAWLTVAVLLAGMWSMWNALVRRRYTETAGALALSVIYIVIALAFVTQPERTIGTASHWTNQISTAFLSLSANATVGDQQQAKQDSSDHLFDLLVYQPWVVLQFGGLEHCARDTASDNPVEVPVRPLSSDPSHDAQLERQLAQGEQVNADANKVCVNDRNKYASHFLRFEPDSDQRNAEYNALKAGDAGKLPDEDPGKHDGNYRLGPVDKAAAAVMDKGGQYQRLGLTVVIFAGELGAYLLLGSLSVAVIVAQVLVLLLLAFAPVALVIGTLPRRGHQFFLDWLTRLGAFLAKKAVYSLILAVLLAVSAALQDATAALGWMMAFGLQAVFFWAVFLNRKQLAGQLSHTVTGASGQRDEARLLAGISAAYAVARLVRRGAGAVSKAASPSTARRGQPTSATRPPSLPNRSDRTNPDTDTRPRAPRPRTARADQDREPQADPSATDSGPGSRPASAVAPTAGASASADHEAERGLLAASSAPRVDAARAAGGTRHSDGAASTPSAPPVASAAADSRADRPDRPRAASTSSPPAADVTPRERPPAAPVDPMPAPASEPARPSESPLLSSVRADEQRLRREVDAPSEEAYKRERPDGGLSSPLPPPPAPPRALGEKSPSDGSDER